ncbi:MAG TPA: hypothetical protein VK698_36420 [Kofleriaceae bacterium]|nr:hypothetical protein [Kofleriaceae bacterium]
MRTPLAPPAGPIDPGHVSFWSGLWVGDADRIGRGLDGEDADEVELREADFVLAHVDLPGILPLVRDPGSPDRLTAIVCDVTGQAGPAALTFAGARLRHLAGDPDEMKATDGAFEMSPAWVALFAGLDDLAVHRIGDRWAAEISAASAPVAPASVFIELVTRMRDACRLARDRGAAVVYNFTL